MNLTRVWAQSPAAHDRFWAMLGEATRAGDLDLRRRAVLVAATASTIGDPYCSMAWGRRLAATAGEVAAASVLGGGDDGLTDLERELARWARLIADDPTAVRAEDVERLRAVGLDDRRIFAITLYVAGRIAFSTVNSALGAQPDPILAERAPARVTAAVRARGRGRRR
jgi:alkylhydroperoxidase family enzyme